MGFTFSRRKSLGSGYLLNVSKRGVSMSKKKGPFSFNTRGRGSVRLGKGLGFRFKL